MTPNRQYLGNYFEGRFEKVVDPNGEVLSVNPGDLSIAPLSFPFNYEHVHEAVRAAKRSFANWRKTPAKERIQKLTRYRDIIKSKSDLFAYWISFETGKPIWESKREIQTCLALIDDSLKMGSQTEMQVKVDDAFEGNAGMVRFFPRGAMAVLCPAYSPLASPHSHLIPALMNGNTIVFKASKYAPATSQLIAECFHEAGLSSGVFNMIHGNSEVARRLVTEPEIDGVFFTGPHETGLKIQKQLLGDLGKHVVLEMGGKNSVLVWNDAEYETALYHTLLAAFLTTGQRCTTTSRIILHEKIFDRFLEDFHKLSKKLLIGYGISEGDKSPFMGPLFTESAVEDYLRYLGIAVREGAEEKMRGKVLEKDKKGYYVSPSIHVVETPDPKSVYQKSEIYGPNVALFRVKELDEAIHVLNLPQTGLVSSVYTRAKEVFYAVAEEARVGILHWNLPTTHISYRLPLGGIKRSGNGRPMGAYSGFQCTYPMACVESLKSPDILPSELPRL